MKFTETPLAGAFVVDLERRGDERGFFARMFCAREFREHGLDDTLVQGNLSLSAKKGTLRGMHFQHAPAAETKFVRCTRGALYDVIVDLRPDSATFKQHYGVELSADNRRQLYVPRGFAHGFLTLTDDTEAAYLVSEYYTPGAEGGVRWNDPAFGIRWPGEVTVMSPKDEAWPDFA